MSGHDMDDGKLLDGLMTLLDRIEIEEDWTLASQRFKLAEDAGYEVEFLEPISGAMN